MIVWQRRQTRLWLQRESCVEAEQEGKTLVEDMAYM